MKMAEGKEYDKHYLLYLNLKLLDAITPMDSNLTRLFKERMFDVPNIRGFIEVMHYLLNIVDPKYFSDNFIWPCINRQDEMKFKANVLKFVNILNQRSDDGIVRSVEQSKLVSPGGPEITDFVWRFSIYAVKVVLENDFQTSVPYINVNKLPPAIIPARIKVEYQRSHNQLTENLYKLQQKQKVYITEGAKKIRDLELECMQTEVAIKNEQHKLKTLIENSDIQGAVKRKFNSGRVDEAMFELEKSVVAKVNDLRQDILVLHNFKISTHICYEVLKELTAPNERVILDGRLLKVAVPTSLKNEMILQTNDTVMLEDIFQLGIMAAKVLQPYMANWNTKSILQHLLSVQNISSEVEQHTVSCIVANKKLLEFSFKLLKSTKEYIYNRPQIKEVNQENYPLNIVASTIQSPQFNFNAKSVSTEESERFQWQGKGCVSEFLRELLQSKSSKPQVQNSSCQRVSYLKMPKQISVRKYATTPGSCSDRKRNESTKNTKSYLGSSNKTRTSLIPTMCEQKSYSSFNNRPVSDIEEEECRGSNRTPKRVNKTKVLNKKVNFDNATPHRVGGSPLISNGRPVTALTFFNENSSSVDTTTSRAISAPSSYEMDNSLDSLKLEDIELPEDLSVITMSPNSTFESPVASTSSTNGETDDNSRFESPVASTSSANREKDCCHSPSGVFKRQQVKDNTSGDNSANSRRTTRLSIDRLIARYQEFQSKSNSYS